MNYYRNMGLAFTFFGVCVCLVGSFMLMVARVLWIFSFDFYSKWTKYE